ncbi:hypothetical protein D9758_017016 [Tetrapyrgos nigripes]|uniref:Protein kinase domain-containing protein n=1 Tax=Tetrapyrgos nigripes TaxID=182062 RepID=A0A8H5F997_9AGAR|nr:hypothetical protein D9758_017016 [Tetrapyrgos nigripes]
MPVIRDHSSHDQTGRVAFTDFSLANPSDGTEPTLSRTDSKEDVQPSRTEMVKQNKVDTTRPEGLPSTPDLDSMWNMITQCLAKKPSVRPDVKNLISLLNDMSSKPKPAPDWDDTDPLFTQVRSNVDHGGMWPPSGHPTHGRSQSTENATFDSSFFSEQLSGHNVDHDEEEDKFDIDDSSPEAAAINALNDRDQQLGQEKTKEVVAEEQLHQMLAKIAARRSSKSRSRSRHRSTSRNRSGLHSGIDSLNRFAGPEPHLPSGGSPRHVEFDVSADSSDSGYVETGRNGTRDDLRTARKPSSKSRIPKDRDPSELESVKTPTVGHPSHPGRVHSRSRSREYTPYRAFAVWGQDESDSNASDSDL